MGVLGQRNTAPLSCAKKEEFSCFGDKFRDSEIFFGKNFAGADTEEFFLIILSIYFGFSKKCR